MERYQRQVNQLKRLEIPASLGVEKAEFEFWLKRFGITDTVLSEERSFRGSFIALSSSLIRIGTTRSYWLQFCPNLRLSEDVTVKMVMAENLPVVPYVLANVSFDLQSEVAERLIKDRANLQEELRTANRVGLTGEELIMLLAFDPHHFDTMLAFGSDLNENLPCLSPVANFWELSLKSLSDMVDDKTGEWKSLFSGAGRVVAPTAKRFIPT